MAELTPKERLQPSLLDRLTDDQPDSQQEGRDKRVLSMRQLRQSVLRDLAWLLNTTGLDAAQDLTDYPLVAHSVLNYGIPNLTGHTASSTDLTAVGRLLQEAVLDFEPRLLRHSIRVRPALNETQMNHNALTFEIEGELWATPVPLRVLLKTELDLEVGEVKVTDSAGTRAR